MNAQRRSAALGAGVFLASGLLIFFLTADLFHPSLDEGIYLEGAQRVLGGETPYRDFFAYTGPLIYWVQAALQGIFGADLRMLRLSTAVSMAITCLATFRIGERLAGTAAGLGVMVFSAAIQMPSFQSFTVNHRWLSTSLAMAAIAVAIDAEDGRGAGRGWYGAGALAAAAAWATPPYLILVFILIAWTATRKQWRHAGAVAAAAVLISLPALAWLGAKGALVPMLRSLIWASRQYSVANSVPFGFYAFAFQNFGPTADVVSRAARFMREARMFIPAVLIPVVLAIGLVQMIRRRWRGPLALLVWLSLGLTLTSWPRWDVNHLLSVSPPCLVLAVVLCEEFGTGVRWRKAAIAGVYGLAGALAFFYALDLVSLVNSFTYFPTRVGLLRNIPDDGDAYTDLAARIPEGATAFVFPYMPEMGFVLRTHNPTTFSYLQPGMMSREDEATVLRQLEAHPPDFILKQRLSERQILTIWPGSDRSSLRFQSIEDFIAGRYRTIAHVHSPQFDVTAMRRNELP